MEIPRWIRRLPFVTPSRRLMWFPPFRAMGIKVERISDDWRQVRIKLPLISFNQNPGGGMFGGSIASLADPIPALVCNKVFPGYQLWTRALEINFVKEARSDLELRFDLDPQIEAWIKQQLEQRNRATPSFEFGLYDAEGQQCVSVVNVVAIRPMGYRPRKGTEQ